MAGFEWGPALKGAWNGFQAGSRFGPYGMIAGALGGGAAGGWGKDIDKKVTGDSSSGMTSGLLDAVGSMGSMGGGSSGGMGGGSWGSSIMNMFSRGGNNNKTDLGSGDYIRGSAATDNTSSGDLMNMFTRSGSSNGGSSGGFDISSMLGGGGGGEAEEPSADKKIDYEKLSTILALMNSSKAQNQAPQFNAYPMMGSRSYQKL